MQIRKNFFGENIDEGYFCSDFGSKLCKLMSPRKFKI